MLLSDGDLAEAVAAGRLKVSPFHPGSVQPASIDIRLSRQFRVFTGHQYDAIDPDRQQPGLTRPVIIPGDGVFILHPGEFALGCTLETVTLPADLAARLEGKSSLGRLGLQTHSTAGWIDPGFSGQVTLELKNVAPLPIRLRPGMRIGQLCIIQCIRPARRPYGHPGLGSRYQGQIGPVESRPHAPA